ncbi:MAG: radical SAM protein [Acidobacteriota bacterium]|nr:radical SAM protein [Acidobacteriota bacterium]
MFYPASYLSRVWLGSKVSPKFLPQVARPLAAHIKLTENCQARCISCDYWKSRWQDAISTDRAISLLDEIHASGITGLRFTGGEPLLRRDFFEIMRRADASRFEKIIVQTNGLLLKKLHREINDSPITKIAVSIDGLRDTNDQIRGIRGYFDLGVEGIRLLRDKEVVLSVTLNRLSAGELEGLAAAASEVGAQLEFNILSRSLYFLANADLEAMWPAKADVIKIAKFLRDTIHRAEYEIDYITRYYNREKLAEPPCVLGYLQVFVLSNGDILTGCYPLKPVGNILKDHLADILASDEYMRQSEAMVRRECPGCTCGVESSLAVQHAASSALYQIGNLAHRPAAAPRVPAPSSSTSPAPASAADSATHASS